METIELDIAIRKHNVNDIASSIKITIAVLLMSLIVFYLTIISHTDNLYWYLAITFFKSFSFACAFLAYFHLKILIINYKVERKHLASIRLKHTIMLQKRIDFAIQKEREKNE
jgi:hypothetical protein